MGSRDIVSSQRQKLEALIGDTDIIPRSAADLKGAWDAQAQAAIIISRVKSSLSSTEGVLSSTVDDAAALRFNRSDLGRHLRKSANQSTLVAAAKVLADEAGIDADGIEVCKKHSDRANAFGPTIYVVLPDEESARKLLAHVRLPSPA